SAVIPTARTIRAARVAQEGKRAVIAYAVCGVEPVVEGASIMPRYLLVKCHLYDLSDMQCLAIRRLGYLLAAAEPTRDYQCLRVGVAHRGQQDSLAALYRYVVVIALLEPERAGHPATSGVEHSVVDSKLLEQSDLVVETQHGFLMTVSAHQHFAVQLRDCEIGCLRGQEFAEQ